MCYMLTFTRAGFLSLVERLLTMCDVLGSIPNEKGKGRKGERRRRKKSRGEEITHFYLIQKQIFRVPPL